MAGVALYKDGSFARVHSSNWDDTKGPEFYTNDIVLVVDTQTWYVYLEDGTNDGWYAQ